MVRWIMLGVWYAAIIYTSSLTSAPVTGETLRDFLIAKFGHVFVYGVLGWLAAEALTAPASGLALRGRVALATTIVLGAVLASFDELRQSFVYGRTGLPTDVVLDTVALSGGALLHHWLSRYVRRSPACPEPPESPRQERPAER